MMISKKLNDAISAQIGRELGASHQYLSIAAYYEGENLKKLAELFYKQSEEEREHALKFFKYILEAGGHPVIPAIEAPQVEFKSAKETFQAALKWEMDVTKYIYELVEIALAEKDYIARQFLDWFVAEQLEEVSSMEGYLKLIDKIGDERNLIMMEAYFAHND